MSDRLQDIIDRNNARTQGEWTLETGSEHYGNDAKPTRYAYIPEPDIVIEGAGRRADAEFIANAPADVTWLVSEVQRLRSGESLDAHIENYSAAGVHYPQRIAELEAEVARLERIVNMADSEACDYARRLEAKVGGLSTRDLHALDKAVAACLPWSMIHSTYLVGTAQTGGPYRDVDVRTILADDEFDRLFTDSSFWSSWCFVVAEWLIYRTGLPIDYQVQRMTEADTKYDGPRNPLGTGRGFAGYGDATPFDAFGDLEAPHE